jgi:hypothetical protein
MAEIPKYSNTVAISTDSPVVDKSSVFNAYSELFGNVSKEAFSEADQINLQKAQSEGAVYGENKNIKLPFAYTKAQQEFNKTALEANKMVISSDAFKQLSLLKSDAKINIDDEKLKKYQEQSEDYIKNTIATTPTENRLYIKNLLTHQQTENFISLNEELTNKKQKSMINVLTQSFDQNLNEMNNAVEEGNYSKAATLHAQLSNTLKNDAVSSNLSGTAYIRRKNLLDQSLIEYKSLGDYQRIFEDPNIPNLDKRLQTAKKFEESVMKSKDVNRSFTPTEKKTLQTKFNTILQNYSQQLGITKTNHVEVENDLYNESFSSGKVNQTKLDFLQANLSPVENERLNHKILLGAQAYSDVEFFKSVPITQQQDYINKAQEDLNNIDLNEKFPSETQNVLSDKIKKLNGYATLKKEDPVQLIIQDKDYKAIKDKLFTDPENTDHTDLFKYIINKQKIMGYDEGNISLLTKKKASDLADALNNAMPDQSFSEILQLRNDMGSEYNFNLAMRDMKKNGLKPEIPLALTMYNNPETYTQSGEFLNSTKIKLSDYKDLVANSTGDSKGFASLQNMVLANLKNELNEYKLQGVDVSRTESDLFAPATQYASYLVWNKGLTAEDASEKAISDLLTKQKQATSFNNNPITVPKLDMFGRAIDINNTTASLSLIVSNLENSEIRSPRASVEGASQKLVNEKYKKQVIEQGHWIQYTGGSLVYADQNNVPISIKVGEKYQPIKVTFNELGDPTSIINQSLETKIADIMKKSKLNRDQAIQEIIDSKLYSSNKITIKKLSKVFDETPPAYLKQKN